MEALLTHHRSSQGRCVCAHARLCRSVSHHDFSHLTWRESLRDIEVCLEANHSKLFHMGIATPPAFSTLSDALNLRDWRMSLRLCAYRPNQLTALVKNRISTNARCIEAES